MGFRSVFTRPESQAGACWGIQRLSGVEVTASPAGGGGGFHEGSFLGFVTTTPSPSHRSSINEPFFEGSAQLSSKWGLEHAFHLMAQPCFVQYPTALGKACSEPDLRKKPDDQHWGKNPPKLFNEASVI